VRIDTKHLKSLLSRRAFPVLFGISAAKTLVGHVVEGRRLRRKGLSRRIHHLDVSAHKRSDTLFVLGGGTSINRITPAQWKRIEAADSVGFNFWFVHDFVPTYYVFEPIIETDRAEVFFQLMALRAREFRNVPIIVKDIAIRSRPLDVSRIPGEMRSSLHVSNDLYIPALDLDDVRSALSWMATLGIYDQRGRLWFVPHLRASLFYLVFFGLLAGYERIVLCGVDLWNKDYFYDEARSAYAARGIPVPRNHHEGRAHSTVDPAFGLPIDQLLYSVDQLVLKPRAVDLLVAFEDSLLHPRIPAYF
jgi:hypothetical protein